SDAGMESGVLLLELYSILHNQPEKWEMPDKMLNAMNWVVATSRYTHRYVPAVYCLYRNIERQLLIAGAAFNPLTLYVLSKDEFIVYDVKGVPLGVEKNYNYDVNAINISEIVIGFIYSDGIVSAVNRNGNPYSIGRIKDIIRLNKEDTPALLARKIYMDFTSFMEGVDLQTDASLLIFKIAQREF
ncbi:MAG: serine/threonine-protein phosphatase, partial [Spirochaetes bacterium]|nr:serine/threonine-protein phosphatase [Spirochaetota bacterium]